jgi:hypothetical protein
MGKGKMKAVFRFLGFVVAWHYPFCSGYHDPHWIHVGPIGVAIHPDFKMRSWPWVSIWISMRPEGWVWEFPFER